MFDDDEDKEDVGNDATKATFFFRRKVERDTIEERRESMVPGDKGRNSFGCCRRCFYSESQDRQDILSWSSDTIARSACFACKPIRHIYVSAACEPANHSFSATRYVYFIATGTSIYYIVRLLCKDCSGNKTKQLVLLNK